MPRDLPANLIGIPSRFLRANRDHPRLLSLGGRPRLVADLHAQFRPGHGRGAARQLFWPAITFSTSAACAAEFKKYGILLLNPHSVRERGAVAQGQDGRKRGDQQ
jgi:hypothetical protein